MVQFTLLSVIGGEKLCLQKALHVDMYCELQYRPGICH
jgi:hypothetical protein